MAARLKKIYNEKIVPELKAKLELKNTMQVPRILKITVNMGVGEAVADKKVMDAATAARIGYRGLMKGKPVVIAGIGNKLLAWSVRLGPRSLVTKISRSILEKK